jgi:hypothetical protein
VNSEDVFLTGLISLVVINLIVWSMNGEAYIMTNLTWGFISGLVITAIAVLLVTGIQIVGTGLNPAVTKISFGIATLLNILFSFTIGNSSSANPTNTNIFTQNIGINGLQVGLGLGTHVINMFSNATNGFMVLGYIFSWMFCLIILASGLIIIIRSGM